MLSNRYIYICFCAPPKYLGCLTVKLFFVDLASYQPIQMPMIIDLAIPELSFACGQLTSLRTSVKHFASENVGCEPKIMHINGFQ